MAKQIRLVVLFSIILLLQDAYCTRDKRGITDFIIPGINVGDIAIDALKDLIFGVPVDKDQIIINQQLEHMEMTRSVIGLSQKIIVAVENAPELTVLLQSMQRMPELLNNIDGAYRQYEVYQLSKRNGSDYRVHDFAKSSANRYTGPLKDVLSLYSLVVPASGDQRPLKNEDYSLLGLMTKHVKGYKRTCDEFKSQQMILLTLLQTVTIAELKVLLVMDFSNRLLAETEKVDYQAEIDELNNKLKDRLKRLSHAFQNYMSKASREVWRCDPQSHEEGKTFFTMQNFQYYIAREIEMSWATNCYYDCSEYNTKQTKCMTYKKTIHGNPNTGNYASFVSACTKVRMCAGRLHGCHDKFNSGEIVRTCPAPQNSIRRYMYIEGNNRRYGPNGVTCRTEMTSDMRETYTFRDCEICLCICDDSESPRSDQKINLRAATADKDHIITNVRWLKKDHTMHLQIQQGKLLTRGKVDADSVHWKDIQEPRGKEDLALIHYENLRGFLLHDVELIKDQVLAGVKLTTVKHWGTTLITLQLLPLTYDYVSGKLNYSTPFYEDPDASVDQGLWNKTPEKISASEYGIGTSTRVPSKSNKPSMSAAENQFLRLSITNFDTDAGQNTVPFFDMQDNIIDPPTPITGVGIYYKKIDDYGGFLGLKLITLDYSPFIVESVHGS